MLEVVTCPDKVSVDDSICCITLLVNNIKCIGPQLLNCAGASTEMAMSVTLCFALLGVGKAANGSLQNPIVIPDLAATTTGPYSYSGTSSGLFNEIEYCGSQKGPTMFFTFSVSQAVVVFISTCNPGTAVEHGLLLGTTSESCPDSLAELYLNQQPTCLASSSYQATGSVPLSPKDEQGNVITYSLMLDSEVAAGGYFNLTIGAL